MKRRNAIKIPPDILAAKKALSERHLRGAARIGPHAWIARSRVTDGVAQAGNQLHAVGVGRKRVEGKLTKTLCVRLYVTQKLPRRLLHADHCLPELIDGIPTDVVEAPPAYLAAAPVPCSVRKLREQRPAQGGISGAHEAIQAGTLAAQCRSRRPEDAADRFVLANNHTLADLGLAPLGSAILQPAIRDGGTPAQRLGGLERFVAVVEAPTAANRVDAAIAKLDTPSAMKTGICSIGLVSGTSAATPEVIVHKHGRTTGYTVGVIDDPSVDVLLPLRREDPTRLTQFIDQIRLRPQLGQFVFAQPGDSGALVLTKAGNLAVGLLFACPDNGSFAYANPIQAVLDGLEIDLL
jgi:hypothetical protein